ncbi:MAG: hypothetical protein M9955_06000 [Rhizobiaceae bacterium]|nr:hypothetical protein [Rhizobiaceae bacterium]
MTSLHNETTSGRLIPRGWKGLSLAGVAAGLLVLAAANAHLVYVALASQPACVPHVKDAGQDGAYRAARSSC